MPTPSRDLLDTLIAFPTVSRDSNLALIEWCENYLESCGARTQRVYNSDQTKANLYASLGPDTGRGVMLSGHTDVVPIDGQDWTRPAFELTEDDGKLFGRGTCDMKGFIACALRAAKLASSRNLHTPLHLALSYDEEIGCIGVQRLIEVMKSAPEQPAVCIVGEPTSMNIATGHKGKIALRATCTGRAGHSALAPNALNAIHLATDFVQCIRELQHTLQRDGARDDAYDIPYTTLHVGILQAGTALNIVPNEAVVDFEIRNLAADDPTQLIAQLRRRADALVDAVSARFPEAAIRFDTLFEYPGLDTGPDSEALAFVKSLTDGNHEIKVAFGTEGGLFSQALGIDTVICGPGSMDQGHKPDEFVSAEQLQRCDAMMERLVNALAQ